MKILNDVACNVNWIEIQFNSIQFKVIGLNWIWSNYEKACVKFTSSYSYQWVGEKSVVATTFGCWYYKIVIVRCVFVRITKNDCYFVISTPKGCS
jgi:hypothetical protein